MYNDCARTDVRGIIGPMRKPDAASISLSVSPVISAPSLRYLRAKLTQVLGRDCADAVLAAALEGCGLSVRLDAPLDSVNLVRVATWLAERNGLAAVVGMGVRIRCLTVASIAAQAPASSPWP